MATDAADGLSDHVRGVTVTTVVALAGIGAGVVSGVVVGTSASLATDKRSVAILAGFVLAVFPVLRAVGVDVGDFGAKDYLYVVFMAFSLWFITFTVLLSTAATL